MSVERKFKKVPIVVLIGAGTKLPALIKDSRLKHSNFYISLVVSHKANSTGIKEAISKKIPSAYFNLPDYRNRFSKRRQKTRASYMKTLGWFITQREYKPKLLVFAGWDLIVDKNFMNFFKCKFGSGYAAINLHPALLPLKSEKRKIILPDGSYSPIIKGEQEQVLKEVIVKKLTYFGPTVHFMVPTKYDTGLVIKRAFMKVENKDTTKSLRKKLMPQEDKILIESISEVIKKYCL